MMNVVCCQLEIVWENKKVNHRKVCALLERAAPPAGSLVLLPEMFATGFSMNVAGISDSASRETYNFLARTAAEYRLYLLGGLVTSGPDGLGRNECVLFSPDGSEVARYCKMHSFTYGGEPKHYHPGSDVSILEIDGFRIAPFICYDLRFPEVFRRAIKMGAELFAVIANWPAAREHHWITLLKARAIENQAYVAAVNRCGDDPRLHYTGRSLIIDPRGEVLADAGSREGTISAPLDFQSLRDYRGEFPALIDMRG